MLLPVTQSVSHPVFLAPLADTMVSLPDVCEARSAVPPFTRPAPRRAPAVAIPRGQYRAPLRQGRLLGRAYPPDSVPPDRRGFFVEARMSGHDRGFRPSSAYVVEIGQIAWSLAQRVKRGEPVAELVRDARRLYGGAWHDELRRAGRG